LVRISFEIKAESFVVLDIPCDRCLESVPTKVEYSVDEIVDFSDNAAGEEAKEEKDYIWWIRTRRGTD